MIDSPVRHKTLACVNRLKNVMHQTSSIKLQVCLQYRIISPAVAELKFARQADRAVRGLTPGSSAPLAAAQASLLTIFHSHVQHPPGEPVRRICATMALKRSTSPSTPKEKNKRRLVSPLSHRTPSDQAISPPTPSHALTITRPISTPTPSKPRHPGPKSPHESKYLAKLINNPRSCLSRALAVQAATVPASHATQKISLSHRSEQSKERQDQAAPLAREGDKLLGLVGDPGLDPDPALFSSEDDVERLRGILSPALGMSGRTSESSGSSVSPEQDIPSSSFMGPGAELEEPKAPPKSDETSAESDLPPPQGALELQQNASSVTTDDDPSSTEPPTNKQSSSPVLPQEIEVNADPSLSFDTPWTEPAVSQELTMTIPEPIDKTMAGDTESQTQRTTLHNSAQGPLSGLSVRIVSSPELSMGLGTDLFTQPLHRALTPLASLDEQALDSEQGLDELAQEQDAFRMRRMTADDEVDECDASEVDRSLPTIANPYSLLNLKHGVVSSPLMKNPDRSVVDLTQAPTPSCSSTGLVDSSSEQEQAFTNSSDELEDPTDEGAVEEDPWLLRRSMLRQPHVPAHYQQEQPYEMRRPSLRMTGPLAKAMSKSSLPVPSARGIGIAMGRVSEIGAKTLERTSPASPWPSSLSQRNLTHASHAFAPSYRKGSSTPVANGRRKLDGSTYGPNRKVGHLIDLLKRVQPIRHWDALSHRNSVDAIFKSSLVLKAIDETPQSVHTEEYYLHKATEFFLLREKDAVSSTGPSAAKAKEYAQLRAARVAREKSLRGILGRPSLPLCLTNEQEEEVQSTLKQRCWSVSIPGATVGHHDLIKLRPRSWLNDESINFYGQLILQRSQRTVEQRKRALSEQVDVPPNLHAYWDVHIFNSFFYDKISTQGYKSVARWTRRVDVFSKDKVLFPVNLSNTHWVTGCIDLRRKQIQYYDSMHTPNPHFFEHVRAWLEAEHMTKNQGPLDFVGQGWTEYTNPRFPTQKNGFDCGVFTIAAVEQLSRRDPLDPYPPPPEQDEKDDELFNFSGNDMPYLRRRFAYEIISKRLLDS